MCAIFDGGNLPGSGATRLGAALAGAARDAVAGSSREGAISDDNIFLSYGRAGRDRGTQIRKEKRGGEKGVDGQKSNRYGGVID